MLGRPYGCGGFLLYGVNLLFRPVGRAVLCLAKSVYIFLSALVVGFLGYGS
jgi:hypothetical protein